MTLISFFFFFSSRRRHTSWPRDWSSDVCSSDLLLARGGAVPLSPGHGQRGHLPGPAGGTCRAGPDAAPTLSAAGRIARRCGADPGRGGRRGRRGHDRPRAGGHFLVRGARLDTPRRAAARVAPHRADRRRRVAALAAENRHRQLPAGHAARDRRRGGRSPRARRLRARRAARSPASPGGPRGRACRAEHRRRPALLPYLAHGLEPTRAAGSRARRWAARCLPLLRLDVSPAAERGARDDRLRPDTPPLPGLGRAPHAPHARAQVRQRGAHLRRRLRDLRVHRPRRRGAPPFPARADPRRLSGHRRTLLPRRRSDRPRRPLRARRVHTRAAEERGHARRGLRAGPSPPAGAPPGRGRSEVLWAKSPLTGEGVRGLGFVPDEKLPSLYRGASAFVYPSLFEGFGIPVVEAMASGVPVVASSHASLDEAAGDAAIRADPRSPQALADAVERALVERDRLVPHGLVHAARFTWHACGEAHLAGYSAGL